MYRIALGVAVAIAAAALIWRFADRSQVPASQARGPVPAGPDVTTPTLSPTLARGEMMNFTLYTQAKPVPEFAVEDRDGRKTGLSAFRGKVVLVNFWATWCGPCLREMPTLSRLQARLGGDGFEVVAIASDRGGWSAVDKFLGAKGIDNLTVLLDQTGRAARTVGIFGMPTTLLIDRRGRVLGHLTGPADWDGADARRLIAAAGGGSGAAGTGR